MSVAFATVQAQNDNAPAFVRRACVSVLQASKLSFDFISWTIEDISEAVGFTSFDHLQNIERFLHGHSGNDEEERACRFLEWATGDAVENAPPGKEVENAISPSVVQACAVVNTLLKLPREEVTIEDISKALGFTSFDYLQNIERFLHGHSGNEEERACRFLEWATGDAVENAPPGKEVENAISPSVVKARAIVASFLPFYHRHSAVMTESDMTVSDLDAHQMGFPVDSPMPDDSDFEDAVARESGFCAKLREPFT